MSETLVRDQALESEVNPAEDETVEAVIISGRRRGEIIHLNAHNEEVWTEEQISLLHQALSDLSAAFEGAKQQSGALRAQVRAAIDEMQPHG